MRGTLAGSAAVHVVLLALLMLVRTSGTVVVPGPDVVQVALLGEPPPPPAPAPVVRPTDTVVPDESDGVRIQKDRPKPKPEVKQQPKPKEPPPPDARPARDEVPPTTAPRSRVVLPYAPVGGGMAGQVAVDESNFEFAYYLQMVRTQVARNWTPPAGSTPGARVVVRFRIARSGAITGLRLDTGSGNSLLDQSALRALVVTQQLPPLPLGYAGSDLGIQFGFEYTGTP